MQETIPTQETITRHADGRFDVEAVRRDFPILHKPLPNGADLVYLDNAASAQKPRQVIEKISDCYESGYANVHRGIHQLGDRVTNDLEQSRATIQHFIGADVPEEVIFTAGTTTSINVVASGWGRRFLEPGDEMLLNEMEHHANLVPWQQVARERGATLRFIPLTSDGQLDLDRLDEVLTQRTKLVAVTAVSNVLGTVNPIDEIADRAKQQGALVLVDAAQSVPHQPIDVNNPDIDFLAFSGHKLYGPSGIGVLYGRRKLLEQMDPYLFGGNMIYEVQRDGSTWAELPAKFEGGTPAIVQAIALGTAIDYVHSIGLNSIAEHEHRLLEKAQQQLGEIPGITIYGPAVDRKAAIISFTVERVHPHDLADLMDQRGVAIRAGHHCTMPLHELLDVGATARVSFGLYNTEDEIDALVDAIHFARKTFRLE